MGQTTRRQPISFNIPAAPDYKFLNITDFAGLNVTDNPFTAKANTASDALNVYVDENNALSTRPRLEKVDELLLKINQPSMILVGVYPIPNGYIIHGNVGSEYLMYSYVNESVQRILGDNIPETKCNVFTHDSKIYLLSGSAYMTIKDNELIDVDGYIPTIKVAKRSENGDYYSSYESFNLLSDKYKETYLWDGISDNIPNDSNLIEVDNKYFEKVLFYDRLQQGYEILYYNQENKTFICKNSDYRLCNVKFLDEYQDAVFTFRSLGLYDANKPRMAKNKPYLAYGFLTSEKMIGVSIFDCSGDENIFLDPPEVSTAGKSYIIRDTSLFEDFEEVYDYGLSPNGNYLWAKVKLRNIIGGVTYISYPLMLYRIDYSNKTITLWATSHIYDSETTTGGKPEKFENIVFSDNEKKAWALFTRASASGIIWSHIYSIDLDTSEQAYDMDKRNDTILQWASGIPHKLITSNEGNLYMAFHETLSVTFWDNSKSYRSVSFDYYIKDMQLDEQNNRLFYSYTDNVTQNIQGLGVAKDLSNLDTYYDLGINNLIDAKNLFLYNSPFYIITQNTNGIGFYLYKDSTEPLVIATKILTTTNNDYTSWLERRENFLNAFLTVRFDNNMWFASNNALYRSLYNDPTYVSSTSYTTLGDGLSEITGFNIAGDDLLVAYKKDRLYLIQPHTYTVSGLDYYDYVYTETKNTVGNEAYGNTIVTVLTEAPIQITKDGIFALNQLKNVQSSDRISKLISQNINKKWLDENDEAVINCQTINRLYWTYFILNDDEQKITKIYLLDNRTSSWYYWELPIITLKAYVNENKTTFIDIDGNVYELKTNDTFYPYNPEETEYYDEGRKLIKWYWQSQILPLGTINYSKRLVNTTFIVSDTDESDEYGLNYSFKIYRKLVSESNTTTISNNLNYVQSVTKKTMIPRFNFIQIKLSNIEEEDNDAFNNNKFRLIGLGLKYVLLEGLY